MKLHLDCRRACLDALGELGSSMGSELSEFHSLVMDGISPLAFDPKVCAT